MPGDSRNVHFSDAVEHHVYTPEAPTPDSRSAMLSNEESNHHTDYRDGIHVEIREPSVRLNLEDHIVLADYFHESVLNAPATSPYVPVFIISSRSFPWTINISRQAGGVLTVRNVLDGIMNSLRESATNELSELRRNNHPQFNEVNRRRESRLEREKLEDISARRIDWLPLEERVFLGLSSEQGSMPNATERRLKVKWNPSG
ncbi:hypothetical protein H2248_007961 [Termitomyces sp. 'cryptogamus']|nr:hypothetical protein H2248_007961 [Termitomyces sp. 'cryptogamus']